MKKIALVSVALAAVALLPIRSEAGGGAAEGLDKLKALAGNWKGTSPYGPVSVSYEVVSDGTAVLERLATAKEPTMVSVYHLDGVGLMMTHYCSAGNQPRMRADVPEGDIKTLRFAFVDCTNLSTPAAGHMRSVELTFDDADHLTQVWTWHEGEKDTPGTFKLERKK